MESVHRGPCGAIIRAIRNETLGDPEKTLWPSGMLGAHSAAIAEAGAARRHPLRTVIANAEAMLNVDDGVRRNQHATPRHLHGVLGVVVQRDQHAGVVCVHRPIGRFKSGKIRCPPVVLDLLSSAASQTRGSRGARTATRTLQ